MTRKLLADSNRAAIREIPELNSDWGTTPAAGVTRAVRFTKSSITVAKNTAVSNEIRSDRMVSSIIETGASSAGDLDFEFSAGNQDGALQRVLEGAWSRPMTFDVFRGSTIAITSTAIVKISGGDYRAYFAVGQIIRTSGFVTPGNNTYAAIASLAFTAGKTVITVVGTPYIVEAGSAHTSLADANDVIVNKLTTLRFGSVDANTVDSNGANVFATANAAKTIVPGQVVYIDGPALGYGSGTITSSSPLAGDAVTVYDGVLALVLTAGTDFAIGVDNTATAANLTAAINLARTSGLINVTATSALAVVTVVNLNKVGGTLTGAGTYTIVAMSAGDTTLGGFFTVLSLTDDALTMDRAVGTVAAGSVVVVKGSMLRNPGDDTLITPQSISLETSYTDVGQSFLTDGLRDGSFDLDVSAGAIITGVLKREGRATVRQARKLNAAPYTALDAPATENCSATANVGALSAGGVPLSSAVKAIKMNIDGKLRMQTAVSNKFPVGIIAGRLEIMLTIEAYFADGTNFDAFINHDTRDLTFPIIDPDGNTYRFRIPAFKITSDPIAPGGIDQDVMETMEGKAFRDSATGCMVQIDRFSSTKPLGK
jgi:hypothetical protein